MQTLNQLTSKVRGLLKVPGTFFAELRPNSYTLLERLILWCPLYLKRKMMTWQNVGLLEASESCKLHALIELQSTNLEAGISQEVWEGYSCLFSLNYCGKQAEANRLSWTFCNCSAVMERQRRLGREPAMVRLPIFRSATFITSWLINKGPAALSLPKKLKQYRLQIAVLLLATLSLAGCIGLTRQSRT